MDTNVKARSHDAVLRMFRQVRCILNIGLLAACA
jgi:hypothetical protein